MVSTGVANLARVLVEILTSTPTTSYVRDEVSRWGAAALVGLPVWVLHWRWAQQAANSDPAERVSTLRRLYIYGVLAGAMLIGAAALHEVLQQALGALAGTATLYDSAVALPFVGVAAVV